LEKIIKRHDKKNPTNTDKLIVLSAQSARLHLNHAEAEQLIAENLKLLLKLIRKLESKFAKYLGYAIGLSLVAIFKNQVISISNWIIDIFTQYFSGIPHFFRSLTEKEMGNILYLIIPSSLFFPLIKQLRKVISKALKSTTKKDISVRRK